ncbi:hypothetical protein E2C01_053009 [Portunus trituberculatus]|uniref:Uncharacterized protein n=1 Tax=Portunus trituberculatus TaxID=210409 RepID=A0A5B7GND4_PORTR|nr:hypothetical protein [Portunus trituberculatus]
MRQRSARSAVITNSTKVTQRAREAQRSTDKGADGTYQGEGQTGPEAPLEAYTPRCCRRERKDC